MKVKELIELLSKHDPELDVVGEHEDSKDAGENFVTDLAGVFLVKDDGYYWIDDDEDVPEDYEHYPWKQSLMIR